MGYTITINDVDRTADVVAGSVHIDDIINDRQNACNFKLFNLSETGMPETGHEVTITDVDDVIIFSGYVTRYTIGSPRRTGVVMATIVCTDQTWLLDRNLVHKTYEDMTDAAIIADIVSTYCTGSGITTTNVIEGVTIDQISFNYVQPSQCIRQLCDLTGRNWYIDYEKDIHYFPLTTEAAPFNIADTSGQLVEDVGTFNDATKKNNATQYSGVVSLKDADPSYDGQIEYTAASPFPTSIQAYAEISSEATNGGGWIYFYLGCSATPRSITQTAGGYLVVISEYSNQISLYHNGTAIDTVNISTSDIDFDDGQRRTFVVTKTLNTFEVKIDGVIWYTYEDIHRSYGGLLYGLGADNNAVAGTHAVTNVYVFRFSQTGTDYSNLQLQKDASQLKNRVYVRGGTKLSDFTTYNEKGDGEKTVFVLPDKPHDISVEVNGTPETLGIKHIHTTGYDWYVNFEEKYIEQDSGGAVLTTSDTLTVEYKYDIPILVALEDSASIEEYGQREFAIFDKTITTTQAARDRASAELTDYGNNIIEGSFTTYTPGFVSGQYINISLTDYDVDADYLVQSVKTKSMGAGTFQYEVSIASAKTIGIIRFLVELLEANKNLIELDDNESVDELFNITDRLLDDSLTDQLTIDSQGAYFTWVEDSPTGTIKTRMRWDLYQWG